MKTTRSLSFLLALVLAAGTGRAAEKKAVDYVDELNFYNTDLNLVLKTLEEKTGNSFVEDVPVRGKVTIHIAKRTPLADVLDQMLRGLNLAWKLEKGVYHIHPKPLLKGVAPGKGLEARTYALKHVAADAAAEAIRPLLSEHGKVTPDLAMNVLTVTDIALVHNSVSAKLNSFDTESGRTAQFNIKIKVLQIDRRDYTSVGTEMNWHKWNAFETLGTDFLPNLNNIQGWGQEYSMGSALLIGADGRSHQVYYNADEYAAFFQSAFTFKVGHFGIDDLVARFRAYATKVTVNVLSEPDVTVHHDKEATVKIGERIPQGKGGGFSFYDSGIILKVKPKLLGQDRIELELNPEVTERAGELIVDTDVLNRRAVSTVVEMVSGETIRIGGLVITQTAKIERRVPVLGNLPLFGYLFKYEYDKETRDELVILVSPHLVENIPPRCATTAGISALNASLVTGTTDVMLDWAADVPFDNIGVVRYYVYRDVRPITATLGMTPISRGVRGDATSWVDRYPKRRGVTYYYAVTGVDGAENEQTASNSPSVTIPKR